MADTRQPDDLEALYQAVKSCRVCVETPKNSPLPHEPRPVLVVSQTARVCICGQAPGVRVHKSGRPFSDPSGERLRHWMGISRDQFYDAALVAILPMGFCFPGLDAKGGDMPPRRECAMQWRHQLLRLMPQLELILPVGLYAQKWHLGAMARGNLTDTVASWRDVYDPNGVPRYLPLPHPSWRNNGWLKGHPWFERDVLPVLRSEIANLTGQQ